VGAQVVIESTGHFTDANDAKKHLRGPVKKVIISAPAKNEDITLVLGVNHEKYDGRQAPHYFERLLHHELPGADRQGDQRRVQDRQRDHDHDSLLHQRSGDSRLSAQGSAARASGGAVNMIPTSTGAAKALKLVIPGACGKLDGFAMRVPTPNVSVVDLVAWVEKKTTKEEVNAALKKASESGPLKGYLGYEENELVSSDFKGDSRSSIVDAPMTLVVGGNCVKVISWYDNEWGYSCRVRDLIHYIAEQRSVVCRCRRFAGLSARRDQAARTRYSQCGARRFTMK
jgi:glyceraldehyde 3-phosphate dehydrogenase